MGATKQISVTLTSEMAERVRAKIEAGEYASESEMIHEGLLALQDRDRTLEDWLRDEVLPAYDALKADPSRALSPAEVRASLAEEHERWTKKS